MLRALPPFNKVYFCSLFLPQNFGGTEYPKLDEVDLPLFPSLSTFVRLPFIWSYLLHVYMRALTRIYYEYVYVHCSKSRLYYYTLVIEVQQTSLPIACSMLAATSSCSIVASIVQQCTRTTSYKKLMVVTNSASLPSILYC